MASVDELLNEFAEAWTTGRRPRVDDYVARAPRGKEDELAELIGAFLELAPNPRYSAKQLKEFEQDPLVGQIASLWDSRSGLWPTLLPRLRARAKLTRDQVVEKLAAALSVQGREPRVKEYYHLMETGRLDPRGVSARVLDALAGIFKVDVAEIEEAGDFSIVPGAAPAGAYLRSYEVRELAVADSAGLAHPPPGDEDEVDRLFRGGR